MDYLDWAPKSLVAIHLLFCFGDPNLKSDPKRQIEQIRKKCNTLSRQRLKELQSNLTKYKHCFVFSRGEYPWDKESIELLQKLITEQRMKTVWDLISKRVETEHEFVVFWSLCNRIIKDWPRTLKLSNKQHKEYYKKIHDYARILSELIQNSTEFHPDSYILNLDSGTIQKLLEDLDSSFLHEFEDKADSIDIDFARAYLFDVIPSTYDVLDDIATKALTLSEEKPLVPKLNSEYSHIHFFVRSLSAYLQESYGKPLHEVVATTTEVIFDPKEISADYVRKLVDR